MRRITLSINKITILVFTIIFFFTQFANAQEPKSVFWSHVRFGGGVGLNFGDQFFSGTLAPSAIYQFNDTYALGVGLNATYSKQRKLYKSTILGGSIIGLYNVLPQIQLSGEFEHLNVNRRYDSNVNIPNDNYWIPALYFGAGYRSQNIAFGIRYDVIYDDERSIYAEPWAPFVRFYF
ncbi:alpha-ketoglutarate decarboxylase [uncultured Algibacter sp.]|uniref:alpha-ketoglutarate decarboxylase n=1 Tax=uncultured Algibacter sp. TaxID=298659 RepID=UPI0032171BD9